MTWTCRVGDGFTPERETLAGDASPILLTSLS